MSLVIYDLSMTLNNHTITYPTDPPVSLRRVVCIEDSGYNVTALAMGTHSGTHVDLPLHCVSNGTDAASVALDYFVGDAVVVEVPCEAGRPISLDGLDTGMIRKGDILIVRTGWEANAGKPDFFINFPSFGKDAALKLIELGVKAVGTDLPSIDGPGASGEIHRMILANHIMVIEALVNLKPLVGNRCFFSAVPLKFEEGDGSPVRAYAIL